MKYKIDAHTHTIASGHAYNTIMEMAKVAADKGIEYLGITEHAPEMPGTCEGIYFSNLVMVEKELYGVELGMGVELNIMDYDGNIDLPDFILDKMDLCIASMHGPCIKPGSIVQNTNAYVKTIENKYVNIIGHPDDSNYPVNYEELVLAAKENNVLLEVNNNSLDPNGFRVNTRANNIKMLQLCKKHNMPIIIGSDAHWMNMVGRNERALSSIEEAEFPLDLVVNYDMDLFKKFLKKNS